MFFEDPVWAHVVRAPLAGCFLRRRPICDKCSGGTPLSEIFQIVQVHVLGFFSPSDSSSPGIRTRNLRKSIKISGLDLPCSWDRTTPRNMHVDFPLDTFAPARLPRSVCVRALAPHQLKNQSQMTGLQLGCVSLLVVYTILPSRPQTVCLQCEQKAP